jgi:hypothetical protein
MKILFIILVVVILAGGYCAYNVITDNSTIGDNED